MSNKREPQYIVRALIAARFFGLSYPMSKSEKEKLKNWPNNPKDTWDRRKKT